MGTLLAPVKAGVHQDRLILLCKDACESGALGMFWALGIFLPRGRTLHFPWLNFRRFLTAHLSCLVISLWMSARLFGAPDTPPSFVPAPSLMLSHRQSLLWNDTVPRCELTAAVRLLLRQFQPGLSLLPVVPWAARGQGWNLVYYYSTSKITVQENLQMNIQGLKCLR